MERKWMNFNAWPTLGRLDNSVCYFSKQNEHITNITDSPIPIPSGPTAVQHKQHTQICEKNASLFAFK